MANRAYTQAARVLAPEDNADVCANHATVCMLLDQYDASMHLFTRVHELDRGLGGDAKREAAWQSVVKISEAIAAKQISLTSEGKQRKFAAMLAELPTTATSGAPPLVFLSQLTLGDNAARTVLLKVIVPVPQTGIRHLAVTQCLIVADQHADLMALTVYALRGVPTLEAGTTLEVREPQLMRIEATRFWEADGGGGGSPPPVSGFHLMRVETPTTHLRINGHAVHTATRGTRRPR